MYIAYRISHSLHTEFEFMALASIATLIFIHTER